MSHNLNNTLADRPNAVKRSKLLSSAVYAQAVAAPQPDIAAPQPIPQPVMPSLQIIPEFLTPQQVEEIYGIKGLAVRRCRGNGPKFCKLGDSRGSKILYPRDQVELWLRAQIVSNTTEHSARAAHAMAEAAATAGA